MPPPSRSSLRGVAIAEMMAPSSRVPCFPPRFGMLRGKRIRRGPDRQYSPGRYPIPPFRARGHSASQPGVGGQGRSKGHRIVPATRACGSRPESEAAAGPAGPTWLPDCPRTVPCTKRRPSSERYTPRSTGVPPPCGCSELEMQTASLPRRRPGPSAGHCPRAAAGYEPGRPAASLHRHPAGRGPNGDTTLLALVMDYEGPAKRRPQTPRANRRLSRVPSQARAREPRRPCTPGKE